MKKLLLAIVAAYIVLMLTNYLVHEVWLMSDYAAIPASHRSPAGIMHRFWAMAVGQFFFAALFAYIYTRGAEKKPWIVQGHSLRHPDRLPHGDSNRADANTSCTSCLTSWRSSGWSRAEFKLSSWD